MKYFVDTEFLEGTQDKTIIGIKYGKTKHTIDLISIGLISEDNREYYAISKDFNLREAWNRWQQRTGEGDRNNIEPRLYWLRENVLRPIWRELYMLDENFGNLNNLLGWLNRSDTKDENHYFTYASLKKLINKYGKTNKQIAEEIKDFVGCPFYFPKNTIMRNAETTKPEFYAYYADYDWVCFCWLFGTMNELPKGFPMYCIDLKQELDSMYMLQENKYVGLSRLEAWLQNVENRPNYPKQTNEHNALSDAKWNFELYKFLQTL